MRVTATNTPTLKQALRALRDQAQDIKRQTSTLPIEPKQRTRLQSALTRIEYDAGRALSILEN